MGVRVPFRACMESYRDFLASHRHWDGMGAMPQPLHETARDSGKAF